MRPDSLYHFAAFEADARTGELCRAGVRIRLAQKPFELLVALLERPGDLVTREELRERLWGRRIVDFDNGLNAAVNKLREALGDCAEAPRFIETLPRRGYRFIAPVERGRRSTEAPMVTGIPEAAQTSAAAMVPKAPPDPPSAARATSSVGLARTQGTRLSRAAVAAGLVVIVVLAAAALFSTGVIRAPSTGEAKPDRTLLAVLPFENLSGSEEEYFSDGLTEELIIELGQLHPDALGVIARASVMQYKGTTATVAEIGEELGVDFLLQGSVRRDGARARIGVQLVQVSDQTQLWAAQYDRLLSDILSVQSAVARSVAAGISLELPLGSEARLLTGRQVDPAAYDAYLRGRHLLGRRTEGSIRSGVEHFRRAIELDPSYAPAYAGLARAYELSASYGGARPEALIAAAQQAVDDALRRDFGLGEAHAVRATLLSNSGWRWLDAEAAFARAVSLAPNSEFVRRQYASHLSFLGRFAEAIAESQHAVELDPLSLITNSNHGIILYRARRYDEALAHLRATLVLDPNYAIAYLNLGLVLAKTGRHADAVNAFAKGRSLSGGHPDFAALEGYARALAGENDAARAALRELAAMSAQRYVSPYTVSLVHVGLGEHDAALEWLERAYADRVWMMALLRVAPELDPLRGEARFAALLERMHFPE